METTFLPLSLPNCFIFYPCFALSFPTGIHPTSIQPGYVNDIGTLSGRSYTRSEELNMFRRVATPTVTPTTLTEWDFHACAPICNSVFLQQDDDDGASFELTGVCVVGRGPIAIVAIRHNDIPKRVKGRF